MASQAKNIDPALLKIIERNKEPGEFGLMTKIVWINVILISSFHILGFLGMFLAPFTLWSTWIFFCVYYVCSVLGVTAGAHRLWSHKSYKAKLPYKILLMLFNCIAGQNCLYVWCRDHRLHHKYSETDADPHDTRRGFFFAHMGWLMMRKRPEVLLKGRFIDMTDLKNDPVVMFQYEYYYILFLVMSVFIPSFIPWYFWNEDLLTSSLVCGAFRYICTLHVTWLVNSAAHLYGKHPYDKTINPAENWFVNLLTVGEGYHNYHHTFPFDYAASEWGPTLNITTCFIDFFAAIGLVFDRKKVSSNAITGVRNRLGEPVKSN